MLIELVLSLRSCLPPDVSNTRQLLAGSVSQFQPSSAPPPARHQPPLWSLLSLSLFLSVISQFLSLSTPPAPPRPAPQFSPVFGWKGFQYNSLCIYIINFLRCLQKPRFSVCITADMVDKIAAVHNMWQ